jgi:hypothetical protein
MPRGIASIRNAAARAVSREQRFRFMGDGPLGSTNAPPQTTADDIGATRAHVAPRRRSASRTCGLAIQRRIAAVCALPWPERIDFVRGRTCEGPYDVAGYITDQSVINIVTSSTFGLHFTWRPCFTPMHLLPAAAPCCPRRRDAAARKPALPS